MQNKDTNIKSEKLDNLEQQVLSTCDGIDDRTWIDFQVRRARLEYLRRSGK